MKTLKNKHKTVFHETMDECKEEGHHFVGNKDLIKEIEKKAYELYESRGSVPGKELDDWLEAERLIDAERTQ